VTNVVVADVNNDHGKPDIVTVHTLLVSYSSRVVAVLSDLAHMVCVR